jgi:hypothetical protein
MPIILIIIGGKLIFIGIGSRPPGDLWLILLALHNLAIFVFQLLSESQHGIFNAFHSNI